MNIGIRLRNARAKARLTQEQAAEALGVSRQTISNWENEKTYPDIISVIKMSDLYCASLDLLLKGEESTSNQSGYLEYLQKSTDLVKSRDRMAKLLLVVSALIIWTASLAFYWCFTGPSDAMGYALLFFWMILPVTILVVSIVIGACDYWGKCKWVTAPICGVLYMLADYATFCAGTMRYRGSFVPPKFGMAAAGALISLAGLGIGTLPRLRRAMRSACGGTRSG